MTREEGLEEAAAMVDSWAEADEKGQGDGDGTEDLRMVAERIRGLKDKAQTVTCDCPGCPTKIPAYSRCELCVACANCDCDHEDES